MRFLARFLLLVAVPFGASAQIEIPEYADFADPYDNLGAVVVADENRLVVGPVRGRLGTNPDLFVFVREGSQWRREAALETGWEGGAVIGSNVAVGASAFGNLKIIAFADPWLAVGMPQRAQNGAANTGAVRLYRRDAEGWQDAGLLRASAEQADSRFGASVAIAGDRLAVGQPGANRVELFRLQAGTWQSETRMQWAGSERAFGYELAFAGDQLVVRSSGGLHMFSEVAGDWLLSGQLNPSTAGFGSNLPWATEGDLLVTSAGSEIRFFRSVNGQWGAAANIPPLPMGAAAGISGSLRGFAVKSGTTLRLAGHGFGVNGGPMRPRYWELVDGAWSPARDIALPASDAPSAFRFTTSFAGMAFAFAQDRLFVGARLVSVGRVLSQGAAYAYTLGASGPAHERTFRHGNGRLGDNFGHWVAIDGEWALVAARGADVVSPAGILRDTGAVQVYRKSGTTWAPVQTLALEAPEAFNAFGERVALKGALAVVAAQGSEAGIASHGQMHVFRRNAQDTWAPLCRLTAPVTPDGQPQAFRNRGDGLEDSTPMELMATDGEHIAVIYMNRLYAWRAEANGCSLLGEIAIPDRLAAPGAPGVTQAGSLQFETLGRSMLQGRLVVSEFGGAVNGTSPPFRTLVFDFDGSAWVRSFTYTSTAADTCAQTFGGGLIARDHLQSICFRGNATSRSYERVDWRETAPGVWTSTAQPLPALGANEGPIGYAGETLITTEGGPGFDAVSQLLRVREPPSYDVVQQLGPTDACLTFITGQMVFLGPDDVFVPCPYANGPNGRGAGALQIFSRAAAPNASAKAGNGFGPIPQQETPPPRPDLTRDGFEAVQ